MSYSTQRYDGGNQLALRDVSDGSRNAGLLYALDTFTISPALTVSYGGRYAQYDYLEHQTLLSPRVGLTVSPVDRFRITTVVSRQAQAPGAEEFLPPADTGIWLPPQRTFSSLERGQMMEASRTTQVSVGVERDIARSTVAFRAFSQRVDDQLVTLFGVDLPSQPGAKLGHYLIGNAGNLTAQGCSASLSTMIAGRVQGSVAYSLATGQMEPARGLDVLVLLAPSALRPVTERIHDVSTTIRADVPETATKVVVLYRVSNAFARAAQPGDGQLDRPGFDSRFDVQVRQSLPFLDFSAARWEMLVAVRNFFRDTTDDQSLYDELLRVPLLIKLPGSRGAGLSIEAQVRGIDLAPTILEELDLPIPPSFEGSSLVPAIAGTQVPPEHAVSQKDVAIPEEEASLRTVEWKWTQGRLFHLASDALETTDVSGANSATGEAMSRALGELRRSSALLATASRKRQVESDRIGQDPSRSPMGLLRL
jgi:hypothetical protein